MFLFRILIFYLSIYFYFVLLLLLGRSHWPPWLHVTESCVLLCSIYHTFNLINLDDQMKTHNIVSFKFEFIPLDACILLVFMKYIFITKYNLANVYGPLSSFVACVTWSESVTDIHGHLPAIVLGCLSKFDLVWIPFDYEMKHLVDTWFMFYFHVSGCMMHDGSLYIFET